MTPNPAGPVDAPGHIDRHIFKISKPKKLTLDSPADSSNRHLTVEDVPKCVGARIVLRFACDPGLSDVVFRCHETYVTKTH